MGLAVAGLANASAAKNVARTTTTNFARRAETVVGSLTAMTVHLWVDLVVCHLAQTMGTLTAGRRRDQEPQTAKTAESR